MREIPSRKHHHQEPDVLVSRIAAAIGEPARVRMLYSLADGHARTSTELAVIAEVSPSTASVHLNRLLSAGLLKVMSQGKHRYFSLSGSDVAAALEGLSVLTGSSLPKFVPSTPLRLRLARKCYDHIAGRLGVMLHNHFREMGWISATSEGKGAAYELTESGTALFESLGIDVAKMRLLRRKFAYPCLDWSERQPHIGGACGAALLSTAIRLRWVDQDLDSRSLQLTTKGRKEIMARFGMQITTSAA